MKRQPDPYPFARLPVKDSDWTEQNWRQLINWFIDSDLLTARELAALMLGHLNPSQVGTSIASKPTFQAHFPPRKIMRAVNQVALQPVGQVRRLRNPSWNFRQTTHLREKKGDAADRLKNMTLRCRRCNVIRRHPHKHGGKTFLTAEAALMWILFVKRPRTYLRVRAPLPRLWHDDGKHPLQEALGDGALVAARGTVLHRQGLQALEESDLATCRAFNLVPLAPHPKPEPAVLLGALDAH